LAALIVVWVATAGGSGTTVGVDGEIEIHAGSVPGVVRLQ
jgi:hypothetical protein